VDRDLIARAEMIVFALYPTVLLDWVKRYGHLIRPGTVVTDVTGVKSCILDPVNAALPDGEEFVSVHPMAGREVSGVENSTDKMFIGANYIVTPTEKNTQAAINDCLEIGKLLGFGKVCTLTPEKHDEMIGFVSQLTHCIAVSLMTCYDDKEKLQDYTGDSFRDLTRIARINDEMWSELFLMNKEPLLAQMDKFLDEFSRLRRSLEEGDRDTMRDMMRLSTARRALFDKK
jgi:prephenate dehydrogenase